MDNVVIFELCDLIDYDNVTGNIVVDKMIFDEYEKDAYIDVQFAEDKSEVVSTYIMVMEDSESIYMNLVF